MEYVFMFAGGTEDTGVRAVHHKMQSVALLAQACAPFCTAIQASKGPTNYHMYYRYYL